MILFRIDLPPDHVTEANEAPGKMPLRDLWTKECCLVQGARAHRTKAGKVARVSERLSSMTSKQQNRHVILLGLVDE
jgi:hypothetical protein